MLTDVWPKYLLHTSIYCDRQFKSISNKYFPSDTLIISHELRLARQNKIHRCVPLVDAVTRICLVSTDSAYSFFKCPKVECYAPCWNQLESVPGFEPSVKFLIEEFSLVFLFFLILFFKQKMESQGKSVSLVTVLGTAEFSLC